MAILPLPESTTGLLAASVQLTSPSDVVKELVDNAIDAGASSVEISLSPDTVDKLSVRGNGRGIPLEDFPFLGRRAHTSKLTSFDDLPTKSGTTLGFRGEALASANSVALIHVSTRVEGDPVASHFQLRPGVGGAQNQRPVSAPVGTTIHLTRLFHNMPARKCQLLKQTHRTLGKIKKLLEAYAFARPKLKLLFKVLHESAHSWSYSPSRSPTARDVALQLFGRELAVNCFQVTSKTEADGHGDAGDEIATLCRPSYQFQAFVPRPDGDTEATRGKGVFISVDQRPLAPGQGTAKKVVSILKRHLSRARTLTGPSKPPSAPFMQLDVRCPQGSYDVNVAPLKDEVLFVNEEALLRCFDSLCQQSYSTADPPLTKGLSEAVMAAAMRSTPRSARTEDCRATNDQFEEVGEADPGLANPDKNGMVGISGPYWTRIRLVSRVDMSRDDSNATDELCLKDAVDIQLPAKPTMAPAMKPQRPRARALAAENIVQYCKPRGSTNDFEIACDGSATVNQVGRPGLESGGIEMSEASSRRPLETVSEYTLNRMEESPATEAGVGRGDPEIQQPEVPFWRSVAAAAGNLEPVDDNSNRRNPYARTVPPSRGSEAEGLWAQTGPVDYGFLPTPPSSDPNRGELGLDRAARRQGQGGPQALGPRLRVAKSSGGATEALATDLTQTPIMALPGRLEGGNRRVGPETKSRSLLLSDLIADGREKDGPRGDGDPGNRNSNWRPILQPIAVGAAYDAEGSTGSDLSEEVGLMRKPKYKKSQKQVMEMLSAPDSKAGGILGLDGRLAAARRQGQADGAALMAASEYVSEESNGEGEHNVVGRLRRRTRHRDLHSVTSADLPLETVAVERDTGGISAALKTNVDEVGKQLELYSRLDVYMESGRLAAALPLRSMQEARRLEGVLRREVKLWMRRERVEAEVVYTLQQEVKGKGRRG